MEKTFAMIKPDAVQNLQIGNIISHITKEGFKILGLKQVSLSLKEVCKFYDIHKERPFYGELTKFVSSGPVVLLCLEKNNAIGEWRRVIGATDPADAEDGTIRKLYARSKGENAVHGSDSLETAKQEISFFFSERELLA